MLNAFWYGAVFSDETILGLGYSINLYIIRIAAYSPSDLLVCQQHRTVW